MISLLAKFFIENSDDVADPVVREKYGILCGFVGIFFNILLFVFKFVSGLVIHSVAVTADAFNNLSDVGSSLISILGFKLSLKKPDASHPFGHGRAEYVAGMIISFLIIIAGLEILRSSVRALFSGVVVERDTMVYIMLGVSIAVKLYMFAYNHFTGKKVGSPTLEANAKDSLSDVVSTLLVIVSIVVSRFASLPISIDGIAGIIVSAFIVYSGVTSAIDTINPLLGQPPSKEFVEAIKAETLSHAPIIGVHDIIVHDYGAGRKMISLHAEVPSEENFVKAHDAIDNTEVALSNKFGCGVTIHIDPTDTKNPEVTELLKLVQQEVATISKGITIHDFRVVPGHTHKNLVFDVVNPYTSIISDEKLRTTLISRVKVLRPECNCVITIDHPFVPIDN